MRACMHGGDFVFVNVHLYMHGFVSMCMRMFVCIRVLVCVFLRVRILCLPLPSLCELMRL